MDTDEIAKRVNAFDQWHYELDLKGVRTPVFDSRHRNRHLQRTAYFFDPLVQLCGGSLAGRRVLDLGCNAGYWSLLAAQQGAEFILGVDGRQDHIAQAELVFEANDVAPDRYAFVRSNIFDLDLSGQRFDVVLCLGLMYHVAKPVELFELISEPNDDLLLIDTSISRMPGKAFEMEPESLDEPRDAVDFPFAFWPTRAAVFELLRQFGYEAVVLHPSFTSWEGCADYRFGFRRAFVCSRRSSLESLSAEGRGRLPFVRDLAAWSGGLAWRGLQRRH